MPRVAFATRSIDEAGNAVGGSSTEVRIYDDFACTVASVVTADSAGAQTIAQPITPNAGTATTLTVTTGTGDTNITVASTTGFALGQFIPITNGTTTIYRWITAILSGPARLTLNAAVGVVFSNTNTTVGNLDMQGVVAGYVTDTSYHYIQTKDVASTRLMPPTLLGTQIGTANIGVLEEGAGGGTRPTINFISPFVTAADNAPSTRVDITGPTAAIAGASAVADTAAEGANTTVARSDHRHSREAFAAPGSFAYALANGVATTLPRADHTHGLSLTTASAALAADATITVAGTYTDGPTVSCVAGTWLVTATLTFKPNTSDINCVARISDGTTHYANAAQQGPAASGAGKETSVSVSAIITLGGTTTIKAQGTVSAGTTSLILAATTTGASGNLASHIRAVRVA